MKPLSDSAEHPRIQEEEEIRILLVEDEAINLLFMQSILKNRGFNTDIAVNGQEAVEKFKSGSFKIVFMDLGMPILGGLAATRAIRQYESKTGQDLTPIIALTAYSYKSDIEGCLEAGMNDFISKPIDEVLLFQKIEKWRDGKTAEK